MSSSVFTVETTFSTQEAKCLMIKCSYPAILQKNWKTLEENLNFTNFKACFMLLDYFFMLTIMTRTGFCYSSGCTHKVGNHRWLFLLWVLFFSPLLFTRPYHPETRWYLWKQSKITLFWSSTVCVMMQSVRQPRCTHDLLWGGGVV